MGPSSTEVDLLPGSSFHVDFGFMHASSDEFLKTKQAIQVVLSYDGYNSFLLLTDAATHYTWVFLIASKDPPIALLVCFLEEHGLKQGYLAICMDQGGEFWNSSDLCLATYESCYCIEPTANDSANQNGMVERLNGTFGIMVCTLLYSSGFPQSTGVLLLSMLFISRIVCGILLST